MTVFGIPLSDVLDFLAQPPPPPATPVIVRPDPIAAEAAWVLMLAYDWHTAGCRCGLLGGRHRSMPAA